MEEERSLAAQNCPLLSNGQPLRSGRRARRRMKAGLLDGGAGAFEGLVEEFGRSMKIQQKAMLDAQNMPPGGE